MKQNNFPVKGILQFLRVRWVRASTPHQSSCWRSSCPCSYVVDPHPKLRLQFQVTYCPHLLYNGINGHPIRLRKKKKSSKYFLPITGRSNTYLCLCKKNMGQSGDGMGTERKTRKAQYLQCCCETEPLKKLYPDYLRQSVELLWDKVPLCTNVS